MIETKKKKVLLVWYTIDDNFGDVLLYHTAKEYLEKAGFAVESHEVGDSELKIFSHANECDFMIFAGGGIIERYIPAIILKLKSRANQLHVPYGVIGFGIGTFDYSKYEEEISFWVHHARFFYVRDEKTQQYLNVISRSKKVKYSGDNVFANEEIFAREKSMQNGHGVNLRDLPYIDITGDFEWNILNEELKNVGCNIILPDCNNQTKNIGIDFDNIDCIKNYKEFDADEKIKVTINELQKCEWIIAMRFHIILVAAIMGIIPIPILYCPKVRYLSKQLGIEELAIEVGEWKKIPEKVTLLKENQDKYLGLMKQNVNFMKKRVQKMFDDIMKELKEEK